VESRALLVARFVQPTVSWVAHSDTLALFHDESKKRFVWWSADSFEDLLKAEQAVVERGYARIYGEELRRALDLRLHFKENVEPRPDLTFADLALVRTAPASVIFEALVATLGSPDMRPRP